VALDGDGRNSPFATALVKRIATNAEDVSSILINVRNDVMQATGNRQIPWEHSALRSRLYFGDQPPAAGEASARTQAELELGIWSSAKASGSISGLEFYLQRYPHGAFAGSAKLLIDQYRQEEAARAELAAKEADLKKAEEAKKAPANKQAEEQRKAEETKRAQELAAARQEVREAQEAVKAAEAARLAALKSAEEARKAAEAAKGGAAQTQTEPVKVASLPPQVDRTTVARLVQTELKRVGCDPGSVDGAWGPKAEEALSKFARLANVSLSKEPTMEALQAIAGQKGRICPLLCGAGEVQTNDKCVAKPKVEATAPQRPRQAQPESKGPGTCIAAGGNSGHMFVPCDHPSASRKAF
jgi:flagellar biosynthesis GTPase FlhF